MLIYLKSQTALRNLNKLVTRTTTKKDYYKFYSNTSSVATNTTALNPVEVTTATTSAPPPTQSSSPLPHHHPPKNPYLALFHRLSNMTTPPTQPNPPLTPTTPFLIGVAGGTASGKSTVCQKIMDALGQSQILEPHRKVVTIAQDSFYRELTPEEHRRASRAAYNFDHPNALDTDLMTNTLQSILQGQEVVEIPLYDYTKNARKLGETAKIYPADVVLFEGILAFYFPQVRDLFHMKLFVDTDPDTRLARRVSRDVEDRGRELDGVLTQYMRFVKPAFEEFCLPTKKFADVIIPRGADNHVAIGLIVQHIQDLLRGRGRAGGGRGVRGGGRGGRREVVEEFGGNSVDASVDVVGVGAGEEALRELVTPTLEIGAGGGGGGAGTTRSGSSNKRRVKEYSRPH